MALCERDVKIGPAGCAVGCAKNLSNSLTPGENSAAASTDGSEGLRASSSLRRSAEFTFNKANRPLCSVDLLLGAGRCFVFAASRDLGTYRVVFWDFKQVAA